MLNPGMFSITLQPEENVEGELIFMPTEVIFHFRNEFDFLNVYGIMNTSGLLQSK